MAKEKISYQQNHSPLECAAILHEIADALQEGHMELSCTDQVLVLQPGASVELRLRGKADAEQERVQLDLNWTRTPTSLLKIEAGPLASRPNGEASSVEPSSAVDSAPHLRPLDDAVATQRGCLAWMTHEQLYQVAQEVELEGRSQMNKEELCEALIDASVDPFDSMTKTALYAMAQEANIEGRSQLDRNELVVALKSASSEELD